MKDNIDKSLVSEHIGETVNIGGMEFKIESLGSIEHKNQIIKAKDIDSVVTGMSTGHPVRSLRNQMTREYLELEREHADFMELEKLTLGSLRKAVIDGDTVHGTLMAGQIAGLIHEEKTCAQIIEELLGTAQKAWSGMESMNG